MSASTAPLLRIEGVTKRFGGLVANEDVSFDVDRGQIVGMLGPNGAGKTTLFSCISGFYRPDAGHIYFDGADVTGRPPEALAHRGLVRTFQLVRVFKEMSVRENVVVGAFLHGADRRQAERLADEVIDLAELGGVRGALARNLTIADKKRLELARALATKPKLLLLDEVMSGLTPLETRQAVALLRTLNQRGITLLLVEHVMEVIMPISDRLVVLDHGIKIAEGPPSEIAQDPNVIRAYLGEKYSARR
ncbi:MAG: ABC transporter ATP-binding protein [Chloroflexota bacterium]